MNNFAVSSDGIATALKDSASSLVAANNTYEEAVALIASANRVVQDPGSVGAALRTISLRLRGTSTKELEEAGEDTTGVVESKSKLRTKIQGYTGVDILTDTGAYKSTYEILLEISKVWDDLTDTDQAGLLELIAGKTRSNTAAAILSNTKDLEKALVAAQEAEGSALRENEKYLDSIQGRIDLFNNSVQTLWQNTLRSDAVKWVVDLGTKLVKFADDVGVFQMALVALFTYVSTKYMKIDWAHPISSFKALFSKDATKDINLIKKNLQELEAEYVKAETAFKADPSAQNQQTRESIKKRLDDYRSINAETLEFNSNLENAQNKLAQAQKRLENYTGNNANTIKKYQRDVKRAQANVDALNASQQKTGKSGSLAFQNLGNKVNQFSKQVQSAVASMLVMYAISKVIQLVGDWWDKANETSEEAKESFDDLTSELSTTESELSSLETQLDDIKDKIQEINENTPLTFTDQEELSRLKAESAELQRQIDLLNSIKEQQAYGVNDSAINAANKYSQTGVKTGKTTGENVGEKAGSGALIGAGVGVASGVGTAILGAKAGTALGSWAGPIGMLIGAVIGAIAGGIVGAVVGGIESASEEKVGESLDNMKEQYAKLQEEFNIARENYKNDASDKNKKKFEEAQEALRSYQSNMANYMSEMDSYYAQIKHNWEYATTKQKQEYVEWADKMDAWAIQSGVANAKSNAITRIFGDEANDKLKTIKADIEAAMNAAKVDGTDPAFDFQEVFNSEDMSEFMQRLYDMGLTVTDIKYYFLDLAKAEKEAEDSYKTYDTVKQINALSTGVKNLKDAFGEITEEGYISTETLVSLEETFGGLGKSWENFVDTVATGTGSIREATEAINELLEAYLLEKMSGGKMTAEEQLKTIMLLQQLGVKNAKQYIDAMQKASMVKTIAANIANDDKKEIELKAKVDASEATEEEVKTYNELVSKTQEDYIKEIEDLYGIDLTDEEERLLIEKAITAEKAKQAATEVSIKNGEYEQAVYDKEVANEKLRKAQEELDYYNTENWTWKAGTGFTNKTTGETLSYNDFNSRKTTAQDAVDTAQNEVDAIEIPLKPTVDAETLNQEAENAENELQETFDKLGLSIDITLKDPHELVDDIQSTFDTLVGAQKEYEENGYLSVDTLQTLLKLEPKYLDLLVDEEGNLNLTKDALYNVARARITDMGIQSQKNILESATKLAMEGSSEALREEISVMEEANEMGADFVSVQMAKVEAILAERVAAGELTQAEADAFVEGTMNQIEAVQVATKSALDNLNNSLSSSGNTATAEVEDAFQKAMDYWENRIGANQSLYEQIQNDIDLLEKKGQIAGASYYQAQIDVENERLQHLKDQREEATRYLERFDPGSEKWWEIANTLNDIEGEIDDVTASIQDLSDAMDQVHWTIFDEAHDRFGDLTTQLSNVRELLSVDEDSFFDDGEWTETGVSVLATHIQEIELYKSALSDVNKELANMDIGDFDSEQEYYDKLTELTNRQHDYTKAISDSEQSVVDMYESSVDAIEEYTQTLVDSYNDYIDSVKEALDAERDLYDFKKNVQKQAKDIAEIERRIASLSGSTNKSDIAERRKLEAQLYESRESLNDTYYDHAKQSQQDALDSEREAYEETMTKFVEVLRTSLEEATRNMDEFLMSVTSMVTLNADAVLAKYESTQLPLSTSLTNPWEAAKIASNNYSGNALALLNEWTKDGGFFAKFNTNGTTNLTSPWNAGKTAAQGFGTSIQSTMSGVYNSISSNIKNSITELDRLKQKYKEINDTEVRVDTSGGGSGGNGGYVAPKKKYYVTAFLDMGSRSLSVTKSDSNAAAAMSAAKIAILGEYEKVKGNSISAESAWQRTWRDKVKYTTQYYAKGTTGTTRDEWAITDEFGPELKMYATPDGNLSFMALGSTVVPHDLTMDLIELPEVVDGLINMPRFDSGISMISKSINKPEFNITFDSLVKAENITEETLPAVKKLVTQELNRFTKELNYALKGKGAR